MRSRKDLFLFILMLSPIGIFAQTAVTTTGGTTGAVPVYTGTSTIGNSSITQSGSNVGIGTTTPAAPLSVGASSQFQVDAAGDVSLSLATPATASVSYGSPALNLKGSFWDNNAAVPDIWSLQSSYAGGSYPGPVLTIGHSGSAGYNPVLSLPQQVFISNSITSSTPPAQANLKNLLTFAPSGNSTYILNAIASNNQITSSVSGTGTNTSNWVEVQQNTFLQNTGTGTQASLDVQENIFQLGGGSTAYGSIAINNSYATISGGSGNIGTLALYSGQLAKNGYTGTINNLYGLYLPNMVGGTNNYAIYSAGGQSYFAGKVGIGTATPGAQLEIDGGIKLTSGSTGGITFADGTVQTTAGGVGGTLTQVNGNSSVSGILQVTGNASPNTSAQGGYLGYNALNGTTGETDLISNPGTSGTGGFAFFNTPSSGTPLSLLMRITGSGSVGIANATPGADLASLSSPPLAATPILEVSGDIALTQGKGGQIYYQDGTVQTTAWNGVLQGGDYAESVDVTGNRAAYEPGDVLVVDPNAEGRFVKSSQPYSTTVMGIYSTRPGVVGRRQKSDRSHMAEEVPMAMIGIVPTKVTSEEGPIKPGDLLVTSSTPGCAMKGTDHSQMMGAIIGKALGHLDSGTGLIEVAVSLQ